MWAVAAGLIGLSARKVGNDVDNRKVPMMGVMAAFVFAAQMINFSIPGTGSSGHIGGGMLLAILLGPYAAFLVMASILTVQALFFADGGLLALGCNIINLGLFPCFIAYPLIYKRIVGEKAGNAAIMAGAIIASVVGLQLGALGVVIETVLSGISELPFRLFLYMMMPIHLAIGVVEGVATALVVTFVRTVHPEIAGSAAKQVSAAPGAMAKTIIILLTVAALTGGIVSWFASGDPDGLEWSIAKVTGNEEVENVSRIHKRLGDVQNRTSILPDYAFRESGDEETGAAQAGHGWPDINTGTSVSGLVGASITVMAVLLIGMVLKRLKRRTS